MDKREIEKCFVSGQIDEDWVWKMKNLAGPWVSQNGNSGLWVCVNVYSQYLGILKTDLSRIDFAKLIVWLQPKGLKEGKTYKQLKGSMDQYQHSIDLKQIESYSPSNKRGKIVSELKELFDMPVPRDKQEKTADTVESRMIEFIKERIATDKYASICYGETYCGYPTVMSIETYASEKFKDQKKPSSIKIIECTDEKVSDDTISLLVGRYGGDKKIQLVIAASSGFDKHVQKTAEDRGVCLVRVNPNYEVTDDNILTPRLDGNSSVSKYEHQMLSDMVPMTVPLVIQDGRYITTSLTDFLKRNNIPVRDPGVVRAPYLTSEFIEKVVSQLIEEDVQHYAEMLKKCSLTDKVPYCCIDPYHYARRYGLQIVRTDLSQQKHLGHIDMKNKVVRLTDNLKDGDPRDRFSMAHEDGHYVLHTHPMFREFLERDAELEGQAASDMWEKHWLEVQANYFASCMLMPRRLVELLYNLYWRKWFKCDIVKPMYIKEPMYWDKDFQNVVDPIARHLGVSSAAIKIKLLEMGKLIDPNKLDNKKII